MKKVLVIRKIPKITIHVKRKLLPRASRASRAVKPSRASKTTGVLGEGPKFITPPIKWVGGKTQLLGELQEKIPSTIKSYIEPFVGGGSVMLMMLELCQSGQATIDKVVAADFNPHVINMYKSIQRDVPQLIKYLTDLKEEYFSITDLKGNKRPTTLEEGLTSRESYYYWTRTRYNMLTGASKVSKTTSKVSKAELAALLIFLNKTGFRGLYREGPNGYNVPYGNYVNPRIFNTSHLTQISKLIHDVDFRVADFRATIAEATVGDFVYMDPPYVPEKQNSFTEYIRTGFNDQHEDLFNLCTDLKSKEIGFILSNSHTKLVTDYFADDTFDILPIDCRRAINSKKPDSRTLEVLIT